jgi:tetratricopeptide (TPR) repeat protein
LREEDTLAKSLRGIELAQLADDSHAEAWPRFLAAFALLVTGDPSGAMPHADEMLRLAERLRDQGLLALACCASVAISLEKGDWVSARDFADRGLAADPRFSWILGMRVAVETQMGDAAQAEVYMERLIDVMRTTSPGAIVEYHSPAWIIPAITLVTGDNSRLDVAEEAAQAVLSSPSCTPRLALLRFGQALISVHRNDAISAGRDYSDLLTFCQGMSEGEPLCQVGPCVSRTLGLLSHTMGNLDQAVKHFENALAFCRPAGFRPGLAWTCCDYAETLRERDGEGDRAKAISLLDESLAISSELGMRPLMERVQALRKLLEA